MARPTTSGDEWFIDPSVCVREKRRERRIPLPRRMGVGCEVRASGVRAGKWENLRVVDVSEKGICIEFPSIGHHPEIGDSVSLGIPCGRGRAEASGRICHYEGVGLAQRSGIEISYADPTFIDFVRGVDESVRELRASASS